MEFYVTMLKSFISHLLGTYINDFLNLSLLICLCCGLHSDFSSNDYWFGFVVLPSAAATFNVCASVNDKAKKKIYYMLMLKHQTLMYVCFEYYYIKTLI